MYHNLKFKCILFIILTFVLIIKLDAQVLEMSLPQLVEGSELIITGKVISTESHWVNDHRGNHIYTIAEIQVGEQLKGNCAQKIKIEMVGGTVGDITEHVSDSYSLTEKEEVLLFLSKNPLEVVGAFQGKYSISDEKFYYKNELISVSNLIKAVKTLIKNPNAEYDHYLHERDPRKSGHEDFEIIKGDSSNILKKNNDPSSVKTPVISLREIQWIDRVDRDNDLINSYQKLKAVIRIIPSSESYPIYYKVYRKKTTDISYTFYAQTGVQLMSDWNSQWVAIGAPNTELDSAQYRFKVEVYVEGNSIPVYSEETTYSKGFETTLQDYPPELPYITGITPNKASAGTNSAVTIRGREFTNILQPYRSVFFFHRYREVPIVGQVDWWTPNEIICKVPTSAGSGPVTVSTRFGISASRIFKVSFGYLETKWEGTNPVVKYKINENCSDTTGEAFSIIAAANTWNNCGVNFRFQYDGPHTNTSASNNNVNEIMWGELPAATLARANWWLSDSICVEADITFNKNKKWSRSISNNVKFDIETIALHEFGHWLNLRDLYGNIGDEQNDVGKIMYGIGWEGKITRQLHEDDIEGIRYIYGGSGVGLLTVSGNTIPSPVPISGGNYSFNVNLIGPIGTSYTWRIQNPNPDWVTVNPLSGGDGMGQTVNVQIPFNSQKARECQLVVYSPQVGNKIINIRQVQNFPNKITMSLWVDNVTGLTLVDSGKTIIEGQEYIIPGKRLDPPFTKYQRLYDAIEGSRFYIEPNAIDKDIRINFALTVPPGRDLYDSLGGKRVWFRGVIEVEGHPSGFTFLNNKCAVFKVPKDAGFNSLVKILGWDPRSTLWKFGFFNTQTNKWDYVGINTRNHNYSNPLFTDTVECRIRHFSDIAVSEDEDEITSVENDLQLPKEFRLEQNYPNPFNPITTIKFSIPSVETPYMASLRIYDVLGREVAVLVNEPKAPGVYQVEFNGSKLASGIYFYQLRATPLTNNRDAFIETKKLVLIK